MKETTLLMMKPDGVALGLEQTLAGEIEAGLGLAIVRRRKMRLDPVIVAEHYAHHAGKPFFPGLVGYMTSGPVIAMEVVGEGAVMKIRDWVGATDPLKAAPGTVRARYGRKLEDGSIRNVVHASESASDAEAEIARFFRRKDGWLKRLFRRLFPRKSAAQASL